MTDTDTLGASLSPAENAFFESGGNTEIPADDASANSSGDAAAVASEAEGGNSSAAPANEAGKEPVPLATFLAEKTQRKEVQSKLRTAEVELAELRGKFAIIDRLGQGSQDQQQELTPETDIFGYAKKTGETVAELQKRLDAQDAQAKEAGERGRLVSSYQAAAKQFTETTPDFGDAYSYLLQSRTNELLALGYNDQTAVHEALIGDELAIARHALGLGKNPAETIYELAKQRGYRKAEPAGKTDAAAKLDTIERGQNANKSLAGTGGASGDNEMTAEMLLKMPMPDFEAWCEKNPAKAKRIMGG